MKNIKLLNKIQKIRLSSFLIIASILFLCVIGYSYEFRNMQLLNSATDINIDGSDFTSLFNLLIFGVNSFIYVIIIGVTSFGLLILSLMCLLPWRFICIKKDSIIDEIEYKIAKKILIFFIIFSFILSIIITNFTSIFAIIISITIPSILILLLCILPLKSHLPKINID
jgi:hypothetical protein